MKKPSGKLVVFEDKKIPKIFHNGEWYFSIVVIAEALTNSRSRSSFHRYWSLLKRQLAKFEGVDQLYEKIVQLKSLTSVWKMKITEVNIAFEKDMIIITAIRLPRRNKK